MTESITAMHLFGLLAIAALVGFIAGMHASRWADQKDASYKEKRSAESQTAKPVSTARVPSVDGILLA